jgi:DNA-binding CsgD family transcriptional regulator
VGSFDLAAVRDVGADPTTAADGLGELVDHHLVQRFSTGRDVRFTMNPVIREFARELLDASPERDTVDHAHAVWCASIAREIRHAFEHVSVAEALNGLERNDPNISASVARLVANGRYAEAASMAIDLAPVRASVWHESTIIEWFRATALKAETASVELPIEALMWSAYGDVVERSASVPAGLRRLIELIDRAREVHDHRALMLGLDLVVRSTTWHGDVAESMRSVAEGVEIAEMIGARRSATEFATWQATLGYVAGDTTGAGGLATHALRLAREFDDPILILRAGVLVAIMATFTPTGGGPAPSFESLLDLARETDSAVDELTIILQIVNRDAFAGDRAVFQPALDGLKLAHRLCAPMREAAVVFALSAAAANFGDMEVAARLHAAMLSMWPAIVASVPPNVVEQYEGIVARCREVAPDRFDELLRVGAPTDWNETRRVATGYAHANAAAPPVAGRSQSPELTAREHDVLLALTRGWTNKQIAQDLGMRPKTVTHHCAAIFRKLNVRTRSEATAYAFRHGLTDGGSDQPPRPVDGR